MRAQSSHDAGGVNGLMSPTGKTDAVVQHLAFSHRSMNNASISEVLIFKDNRGVPSCAALSASPSVQAGRISIGTASERNARLNHMCV